MRRWGHLLRGVGLSRFLQWRVNTILMRWLPFWVSQAYLALLGKVYYLLNWAEREQIEENLQAVMRRMLKRDPVELISRRTFRNIFAHYHEKLFMAYAPFGKVCRFLRERTGLEHQHLLDEALARGRGLVLVTGHFGAVEFLPLTLALKGYQVTMVVRFKTSRLKKALNGRSKYVPATLLDGADGEGVLFSALRALRENQILITECDEFESWRPDRKRNTRFLGFPSPLDRTLDLLQRRYGSPVIMGLVCREAGRRYGIRLHPLASGNGEERGQGITERALRVLERYIYDTPDQWYQWKQVRTILGTAIFEEAERASASEADRFLPGEDSAVRAL